MDTNSYLLTHYTFYNHKILSQFQQGVTDVRGIPCDFWVENVIQTMMEGSVSVTLNYNLWWYFSTPWWVMSGTARHSDHRVPVRAVVQGHGTWAVNDTEFTKNFHSIYEFIHFIPGQPDPAVFIPEDKWRCSVHFVSILLTLEFEVPAKQVG